MREQLETAAINKIKALNAKHLRDTKGSIDTDEASVGRPGADVHKSRRKLLLKHKGQHVSEEEGNEEGKLKRGEKPCEICQDHSCDKCQAAIKDNKKKNSKDGDIVIAPSDDNTKLSVESVASIILRVLDEQGQAGKGRKLGAKGKGGTQLLTPAKLAGRAKLIAKRKAAMQAMQAKPASTAVAVKPETTGPSETWVNALKQDVARVLGKSKGGQQWVNPMHDHIHKYQHQLHGMMKDLSKEQIVDDKHRYNIVRDHYSEKTNKGAN